MESSETLVQEVKVKLATRQIEFLKNRAKELGLSEEDVIRWYIISDMARIIDFEREQKVVDSETFSLFGLTSDGRVTDKDIEEVIDEWNKLKLPWTRIP